MYIVTFFLMDYFQLVVTLELIEMIRIICLLLHPGTTDTDLSKPYHKVL